MGKQTGSAKPVITCYPPGYTPPDTLSKGYIFSMGAREFDQDLPIAGAYIRKAASQIESVSDQIKTGNLDDIVRGAQSFARRQPTAFLGLSVLAGFGAVRFLKSSADRSDASSQSGRGGGAGFAPNQAGRPYSDNRGYRDDFPK